MKRTLKLGEFFSINEKNFWRIIIIHTIREELSLMNVTETVAFEEEILTFLNACLIQESREGRLMAERKIIFRRTN